MIAYLFSRNKKDFHEPQGASSFWKNVEGFNVYRIRTEGGLPLFAIEVNDNQFDFIDYDGDVSGETFMNKLIEFIYRKYKYNSK